MDRAYDDLDRADVTNLNALSSIANDYLDDQGKDQIAALVPLLRRR